MSHLAIYVPSEIYPLTTDGSDQDLADLAHQEVDAVRQIHNKGAACSLTVVMVGGDPAGVALAWDAGEIKRGQFKIIKAASDNPIALEIGV